MLKLKVDFWKNSIDVGTFIVDNVSGKPHKLLMTFDTGAYMTSIDSFVLKQAGYDIDSGKDAFVDTIGRKDVPAKEILVRGLELECIDLARVSLGPVLVHAIDMSDTFTVGVLGLNVIREFVTKIEFGSNTIIELVPTFDISSAETFDNFLPGSSRFGVW